MPGNIVDTLYSMGDDALQNQFKVILTLPSAIQRVQGGEADKIALRVTNVDIPNTTMGTYDVHFRSRKITKPSGKIETPNEMSFTFRVDKNYRTYQTLQAWMKLVGNNATGALGSDDGSGATRGEVLVQPMDPQNGDGNAVLAGLGWTFRGAFITDIAAISLDHSTGEPITVQATFNFLNMFGGSMTLPTVNG